MKLREFVYLLGLRPKARTYGAVVEEHELAREGKIQVARWLHPRAYPTVPSQAAVDFLRRFLRPGDVAIDIGAHVGDSALPLALAVGAEGRVFAFEPNPFVFPVLEQNARLNPGKVSIVPLRYAAMREDGTYEFQYGDSGYCNGGFHEGVSRWRHGSAFRVNVEGRNLPAWLRRDYPDVIPRIRLIKTDAEGYDLSILESLDPLLRSQPPYLQVEMFSLRKSSAEYRRRLHRFLVERGYRVYRLMDGQTRLGERITPENLLQWNYYDVFCLPPSAPDALEAGEGSNRQ